jgi:hypothetical protein
MQKEPMGFDKRAAWQKALASHLRGIGANTPATE